MAGSYLLYNELYYNGLMTDWGSEGRARVMSDEMAGRFHSNSSLLHRDFSSRACDARAFPEILHFLLSQPSHLASRRQYLRRFRKNVGDFLKNVGDFPKNVGDFSIFLVCFFCVGLTLFGKLSRFFIPFLEPFSTAFLLFFWKSVIHILKIPLNV